MCVLCSTTPCTDPESHADPRLDAPRSSDSGDSYGYDLGWDDWSLDDELFCRAREDGMSPDRLWEEHEREERDRLWAQQEEKGWREYEEESDEGDRARDDLRRFSGGDFWRTGGYDPGRACCGNPMCDGLCGVKVKSTEEDEIFCDDPACDEECGLSHRPLRDFD